MTSTPGHPERIEDVDIFDPATMENWYPTYDLLREQCPVYEVPGKNQFFVTRYDDLTAVLRDTTLFRRGGGSAAVLMKNPEATRIYEEKGWPRWQPLATEPPLHRRYRELVDPWFSVAGSETRRPLITGLGNDLLDAWIDDGEVEYVSQFALPLPVAVITLLLGFPLSDIEQLKEWSEAWVMPFAGGLAPDDEIHVAEKGVEFQHYIAGTIAEKRRKPGDDVISHLTTAMFDDPAGRPRALTDHEIIGIIDHLYIGGNETTTFALTSGLWLLVRHPEVEAALRADPSLVRRFVDEVVRLESPTQGLYRQVAADTELHGCPIPKGAAVHLRYAAANRDPRAFPDPTSIDLARPNGHRHVAFSLGETHCPGAGLSRLEQTIATEAILRRIQNITFAPARNDFSHHRNFTLRALKELHIEFDRI
ncbi:MAG: cytochrome P450 [Acidimicrobiia bacterium]|nr:cytochrome P450 [Acidimicrobiia bacterium]